MNTGTAKREIWLFTMRFPYGLGEAFLENELPVLCAHFDRVTIVPQFAEGEARAVPPNARVLDIKGAAYGRVTLPELLRFGRRALDLWRSCRYDAPSAQAIRAERRWLLNRVLQAVHRAAALERALQREKAVGRVTFYSYWSHDWATALSLIKAGNPRITFISRAHGFDMYREQHARGWIPFRTYLLRHVERIYAVSTAGLEYLRAAHPEKRDLFTLATLGTTDHGVNPWCPPEPLRIASCSYIIPRKRLTAWVEVLRRVSVPVVWTHFGDGPEKDKVLEAITTLPSNVRVELMGQRSNAEVMAWYSANPVHLFVLYSELEGGVAVAAQEAASFGIPVLATDSGGVRDLLNAHTGRLLPRDPDPDEVARWIDAYPSSTWCSKEARIRVRGHWQDHFSAVPVFGRFCREALGSEKEPA